MQQKTVQMERIKPKRVYLLFFLRSNNQIGVEPVIFTEAQFAP
jgi:hypothetical protein